MFDTAYAFVNSVLGKFAGFNNQCVSAFWAFNKTVGSGESYSAVGAFNLWFQGGQNYIWDTYDRITGGFQYADQVIWSGSTGAYPNGGYGHVAFYSRPSRAGYAFFYSQNPGVFSEIELSLNGVVGALRLKKFRAAPPNPAAPVVVNRRLTGTAMVRTGPGTEFPTVAAFPTGIAGGQLIGVVGYVWGSRPYPSWPTSWVKTKSGYYISAGLVEGVVQGLPLLK